ncbi:uncharacterized protein KY384_001760 [Bacidia gigantensis]|uniref:uncharacterized protein n=1 Tax=Bacidia gigantensis TaxID=2732470 RepID=UPI001D03EE7B|nr:uncharacterized protein KY384_001760 [Bacidia gigantensis]KAG8532978.1 hypothetical protein KY384_001760 [Bacidia gigantensis]
MAPKQNHTKSKKDRTCHKTSSVPPNLTHPRSRKNPEEKEQARAVYRTSNATVFTQRSSSTFFNTGHTLSANENTHLLLRQSGDNCLLGIGSQFTDESNERLAHHTDPVGQMNTCLCERCVIQGRSRYLAHEEKLQQVDQLFPQSYAEQSTVLTEMDSTGAAVHQNIQLHELNFDMVRYLLTGAKTNMINNALKFCRRYISPLEE